MNPAGIFKVVSAEVCVCVCVCVCFRVVCLLSRVENEAMCIADRKL